MTGNQIASREYHFPAPAKLNLMLHVIGRRTDGYHLLETIFCFISLYDDIFIIPRSDGKIQLENPVDGISSEDDLIFRAAKLLQKTTQNSTGATIRLIKRIPMGGGLGGGSSDAATTLLALNHLWQTKLNRNQLMSLGLKLGADVPVFIFGRNAFAGGIGEKLTEINIPSKWYVMIHPDVHASTTEIFSSEQLTRNSPPAIMRTLGNIDKRRNDLEKIVREKYPEVNRAIEALEHFGKAMMTGSGSCVFIECETEIQAQNIYNELVDHWNVYKVRGLTQHPLASREIWGVAKW